MFFICTFSFLEYERWQRMQKLHTRIVLEGIKDGSIHIRDYQSRYEIKLRNNSLNSLLT